MTRQLIWGDGFDQYDDPTFPGGLAGLGRMWDGHNGGVGMSETIESGGRNGGKCMHMGNLGCFVRKMLTGSYIHMSGFAYKCASFFSDNSVFAHDGNISGSHWQVYDLQCNSSGYLNFGRYDDSGGSPVRTVLATAPSALSAGDWHYIEIKVFYDASAGAVEVCVDGVAVISERDVCTAGSWPLAGPTYVRLGTGSGISSSIDVSYDDFYHCFCDEFDCDEFPGDTWVQTIYPNGVGTYSEWTAVPAGTHYTNVDDPGAVDVTDYVHSQTSNARESYEYGDVDHTPGYMWGVAFAPCGGVSSPTANINFMFKDSDGNWYEPLTGKAFGQAQIAVLPIASHPAGRDWDIADLTSAEFGIKITSATMDTYLYQFAAMAFTSSSLSDDPCAGGGYARLIGN